MPESWRPVVGYEGLYEISDHGLVRRLARIGEYAGRWGPTKMFFPGGAQSIHSTKTGYLYVGLTRPNEPSTKCLVHRLVLEAFVGPSRGRQANHKDGDKSNNSIENLEWCSASENIRHCIDVLGKNRGEGAASKLKESDIPEIRGDPRTLSEIANDYGVTLQAIWLVKKRKNWGHVNGVKKSKHARAIKPRHGRIHSVTARHNLSKARGNATGCVGVRKVKNRWRASIYIDGKRRHLGSFRTANAAAQARREAEIAYGLVE